jgi:tRNA U34 5-methylaminomethyl-2-thiouridine-forming methyltransferase MnmC
MTADFVHTKDGSKTLYSTEYQDHYHSIKGAFAESMHVYISCGLHEVTKHTSFVNILEVGFGTGLNALCTLSEAEKHQIKVNYIGVEPEPIDIEVVEELDYPDLFPEKNYQKMFLDMHRLQENLPQFFGDYFTLNVLKAKIQDVELMPLSFDLVYFDPFKPMTHGNVWTEEVFGKIFHSMKYRGILLTYSSGGEVRRAMEKAGFIVEKIPGPPGKHEITRARKPANAESLVVNDLSICNLYSEE